MEVWKLHDTTARRPHPRTARMTDITVPRDAELAAALRGSGAKGARHERLVHLLYIAADPTSGKENTTVRYLPHELGEVAADVAVLLARACAENLPAAGKLADLARTLGVTEPAAT